MELAERIPEVGVVYNMGQVFEIVTLVKDAIPFAAIASVLIAWLRARGSRKIIVTRADGSTIHLEGLGPADVTKVLINATQLLVLETKKPDISAMIRRDDR